MRELRGGDGSAYTEALASALPQLSGGFQKQARTALAERLKGASAATLREKFQQDNGEMRRAAAAAAAGAGGEVIPDLIPLLYDPELEVAEAAHVSLKELSGQDLGPAPRASYDDRVQAAAEWQRWWAAQTSAKK